MAETISIKRCTTRIGHLLHLAYNVTWTRSRLNSENGNGSLCVKCGGNGQLVEDKFCCCFVVGLFFFFPPFSEEYDTKIPLLILDHYIITSVPGSTEKFVSF